MTARARIADRNYADTAILTGGGWSAALPLANLQDQRMVSRPARCETPANLAASQFVAELTAARGVGMVFLAYHTLSLAAQVRIRVATDEAFADVVHDSGWIDAFPRLFPSTSLPWTSENWWTGRPTEEEIDLLPRHFPYGVEPLARGRFVKVEVDDAGNAAGWFDIGYLFIVESWSPSFNFEHGRTLGVRSRSLVQETPSGRRIAEARTPRRFHRVSFADLTRDEAMQLLDAGLRADVHRPVLFVPDLDDAVNLRREAFPANFAEPPPATLNLETLHAVPLALEEIIT